jgi:16S rRNA pseudouridine516 synthase
MSVFMIRFLKKVLPMKNSLKRIDAHLSSLGYCSRSESKKFLKMFQVCINGNRVFEGSIKALHHEITIGGVPLDPPSLSILMHKPKGIICSHEDAGVLIYSLLPERWQKRNPKISTVGRLDGDTTGVILLTDNGALNHKLTSPKNKVSKLYEVTLAQPLRGDEQEIFASGTLLLKGEKKPLQSAAMEIIGDTLVRLEIHEGKYHQVKRMFAAVGNKVIALHRVRFAEFDVADLAPGEYKIIAL